MSSSQSATPSGSSKGSSAHAPNSVHYDASSKSSKIHQRSKRVFHDAYKYPIEQNNKIEIRLGQGTSNFKRYDPLIVKTVSKAENGDRMEFRNRGTKLKYRHTFEQDGKLRESHKLGFPHFVIIRNFKKEIKN